MQYRLLRGDMIEVWKIINGSYSGEFEWLEVKDTVTRGNTRKLQYDRKNNPHKRRALSFRVQKDWRSLPPNVVSAETINQFKSALDRHWSDLMYVHPGP